MKMKIIQNCKICGATYLRQYYRQYYCTTAVVLGLFSLARFAGTTAVVPGLPPLARDAVVPARHSLGSTE